MRSVCLIFAFLILVAPLGFCHEVTVGIESLGDEFAKEDYILSEDSGSIAGVVSRGVTLDKSVSGGYTELTQDGAGNLFYVFFTRGGVDNLVSRSKYLKDGTFDSFYSPSFGFELVQKKNIVIRASYDSINIIGAERMGPGNYNLLVRYDSVVSGIPQIAVSKSN